MATFNEIVSRVNSRLKDPSNVDISASDVAATINDSITEWSKRRFWFNEFKETVTLVVDDPFLPTLPNSITPLFFFKQDGIVIDYAQSRWMVDKVSPEQYDEINVQGRGIPYVYTQRAGRVELYWYPDAAYSAICRGVKAYAPLTLADGSNTNDWTVYASDLIMYEALSRLMAEFRQDPKMEEYYSNRVLNCATVLQKQTNKNNATGRMDVKGF